MHECNASNELPRLEFKSVLAFYFTARSDEQCHCNMTAYNLISCTLDFLIILVCVLCHSNHIVEQSNWDWRAFELFSFGNSCAKRAYKVVAKQIYKVSPL